MTDRKIMDYIVLRENEMKIEKAIKEKISEGYHPYGYLHLLCPGHESKNPNVSAYYHGWLAQAMVKYEEKEGENQ
jgi:hypothetical protein